MKFVREKEKKNVLEKFLNITWEEIQSAEREGREKVKFSTDVLKKAWLFSEMPSLLRDNLEQVLKREGLLPEGAKVEVHEGSLTWDCGEVYGEVNPVCSYLVGFEVYDNAGHLIAGGDVEGYMIPYELTSKDLKFLVLDMTASISVEGVKTLKSRVEPMPVLKR